MRTHTLAFLAALLLLLGLGAGTAAADSPTQAVDQVAGSQQTASSDANATQVAPSNRNISVRIGSGGDNGSVTQTNAAGALALAGNVNQTGQSATQAQSGAGTQAVGQAAANKQDATANAGATQIKPSNENISVRIHSPGDDGDVEQTNAAAAACGRRECERHGAGRRPVAVRWRRRAGCPAGSGQQADREGRRRRHADQAVEPQHLGADRQLR